MDLFETGTREYSHIYIPALIIPAVTASQGYSAIYTNNTTHSHVRSSGEHDVNILAFEFWHSFPLSPSTQYLADRASVTYIIHINPDPLLPILYRVLNTKKHCLVSKILITKAIKIHFTWVYWKCKRGFY